VQCGKDGIDPGEQPTLRSLGSTGAPLPPEAFRWVHDVLPGTWLTSISGGTDVCTAVVGGSPLVPVWEGEISCRHLGCDVRAVDVEGRSSVGVQGELVIAQPMPSMPVGFVGDPDRSRYRAAYFAEHPGVWTHGDWITITDRGSCVISGRSDATLNRNGVRMGTSEFYGVVDALPEVDDSLVVDVDGELLLFVQLAPGRELSAELEQAVRERIRRDLSPRHVPDAVAAVPAIPRTHTGKRLEVPIKRLLTGLPVQDVLSPAALADPSSMAPFERFAAARRGGPTDLSTTPHNPRRNTR
jgi:acetoacetyl-CoA synthetase